MANLRDIKKRMSAVKNIQRITKTMQMIATAKFTAALQRSSASKPYSRKIRALVARASAAAGEIDHPLINGPAESPRRELLLVIGSDRGLCGAYNGNVLRNALRHLRGLESRGVNYDLHTSGKKPLSFFRFQNIAIAERHPVTDPPQFEQIRDLADQFIAAFTAGQYDAVRVAYMRYESNARQVPDVMQLLPLRPEAAAAGAGDAGASERGDGAAPVYEFSPSGPALLDDLLPLAVKTALFQAYNDAAVSEQIMRMVAMKAATENAGEVGRTLKRDFNRARQSQITTELMEVIGGAAALE